MKDGTVDKLVREAMERLHKDNAVFCEDPGACDSIRSRILEQAADRKRGNGSKTKR
jgi:hypothetical protein